MCESIKHIDHNAMHIALYLKHAVHVCACNCSTTGFALNQNALLSWCMRCCPGQSVFSPTFTNDERLPFSVGSENHTHMWCFTAVRTMFVVSLSLSENAFRGPLKAITECNESLLLREHQHTWWVIRSILALGPVWAVCCRIPLALSYVIRNGPIARTCGQHSWCDGLRFPVCLSYVTFFCAPVCRTCVVCIHMRRMMVMHDIAEGCDVWFDHHGLNGWIAKNWYLRRLDQWFASSLFPQSFTVAFEQVSHQGPFSLMGALQMVWAIWIGFLAVWTLQTHAYCLCQRF